MLDVKPCWLWPREQQSHNRSGNKCVAGAMTVALLVYCPYSNHSVIHHEFISYNHANDSKAYTHDEP